jgi:L-threonylcarbamoyladenylate synthase
MNTLVLGPDDVAQAAAILKAGGLVAFPTETVYGLGADATNSAAVERVFVAKGRPADNPLIVHVADARQAAALVREVPLEAKKLMAAFWPGPLTLLLWKAAHVSDAVTRGLPTVGVRVPHHPVALALLKEAGVPLAAPSANASGKPSPTAAEHVLTDLEGRIDAVLDGGPTGVGLESTVLDLTVTPPVILRPGGLSRERIEAIVGPVTVAAGPAAPGEAPRSPGMKYRHYAPHARLLLFTGGQAAVRKAMRERYQQLAAGGHDVGVLCSRDSAHEFPARAVLDLGPAHESVQAAALLYSRLRALDERAVDVILAEGLSEAGLGLAVMNRLRRAAAEVIEV